jgi:hypothetical protein
MLQCITILIIGMESPMSRINVATQQTAAASHYRNEISVLPKQYIGLVSTAAALRQ